MIQSTPLPRGTSLRRLRDETGQALIFGALTLITGSIWEREVFGCYLFAPAFFWEDVFSFLVLTLHTAYLVALFAGIGDARQQMLIALAAYASYFINATQFLLKLRAARRDERLALSAAPAVSGRRA